MSQRYKIRVDHNKCVGSTLCIHFSPGAFALNEKGQSTVIDEEGDTAANILEAAEQCPQCAIILEDADSREQVFP